MAVIRALHDLPAPAKINLFLHITGRRADGYHLLESVFSLVQFGDSLDLTLRADGQVQQTTPIAGVAPEQDLCVRAARALQVATGCQLGVDIAISKRIPQGAGLGGGSSDAATVLMGLNRLWGLELSRSALQKIGLSLGADVPFFIFGQAAFVSGVGEVLRAVDLPCLTVQLLLPDAHVPTATVFKDPQLKRDSPPSNQSAWLLAHGSNTLAPIAAKHYPAVAAVLNKHPDARMSGSGAACFRFNLSTTELPHINTRLLAKHPLKPRNGS
jgi:4-diphosphocytidyl-2-C-methyl-D-erythritol kinase